MLRRRLRQLHLLVALAAGLLVALGGLAGSVLVFGEEIDRLLNPHLYHVEPGPQPASAQAVRQAAERAFPGEAVRYLFPAPSARESWRVQLVAGDRVAHIDPATGNVLGCRAPTGSLIGFLRVWHTQLLAGETGKTIIGAGGVALLWLCLSGVLLWWPGIRGVARSMRIQWAGSWKRTNYDLHRVLGVVVTPVLLLSAITGISLAFSGGFTRLAQRAAPTPPSPPPLPRLTVTPASERRDLDALLAIARGAVPTAQVTRIALPAEPDLPLVVRMRQPEDVHPNGMSFVHLDPSTGKVLRADRATDAPGSLRLLHFRFPLHTGTAGGTGLRLVLSLGGLMPFLLLLSGCLMWWNRTRGKRRTRIDRPQR